jgi:hypothetical protein
MLDVRSSASGGRSGIVSATLSTRDLVRLPNLVALTRRTQCAPAIGLMEGRFILIAPGETRNARIVWARSLVRS